MTTDPDDDTVVTHQQPTLPAFELPDYHGRTPVGMRTSLAGAGTRVTRAHTIGDRVVLVIEARVKNAAHEETDDGLVYSEKLKVLDLFELEPVQGSRLLSTIRSIYRSGEDKAHGRTPLPDLGEVGYTDASGVVLTPDEIAELRGDPVRALLAPELTPAVIVYDSGARDLWPDDYPKDAPRPRVGQTVFTENGDAVVEKLLNHETGEALDVAAEAESYEQAEARLEPDAAHDPATDEDPDPFPPASAEVPELPEADPFAGTLDDDAAGWEDPDPATAERIATAEADNVVGMPTEHDLALLDAPARDVLAEVQACADPGQLARMLTGERSGRGKKKAQRPAVVKALVARIAELGAS